MIYGTKVSKATLFTSGSGNKNGSYKWCETSLPHQNWKYIQAHKLPSAYLLLFQEICNYLKTAGRKFLVEKRRVIKQLIYSRVTGLNYIFIDRSPKLYDFFMFLMVFVNRNILVNVLRK